MSLLALREVSKRFGGVKALAGVSFAVDEGDVLGVIGPNGAGKTTLLNCISGLYRPDTGDIRWGTASIRGMAPYRIARLGIGRTFQIVRPFPSMTVRENTAMGALFGRPGARLQPGAALNEADAVLDVVGLGEKRHYPVLRLTVTDRKRLEDERHRQIEKAMKIIPNYHPPSDYRRPTKTQEKVYVPVNDYPEINFSTITNSLTLPFLSLFASVCTHLAAMHHIAARATFISVLPLTSIA